MSISSLPRSLDVQISLTKAATELRTNLSLMCFVIPYQASPVTKLTLYSSLDAVAGDFLSTSQAYAAAEAYFSQTPNAGQFAVGILTSGWSDIAHELDLLKAAAKAIGTYVYGWALEKTLRVLGTQEAAATWALANVAIMPLVTNDTEAYDPASTTDLGAALKVTANRRAPTIYHDTVNDYPDVSILAYMLSVNYGLQNSTVTAKFKKLPGITTVNITETQWAALKAKGYNCYTYVGNSSLTYREGTTEDTDWYMDSVINLDNFVEDLSVNVYNVFLRNKKVPYTRAGQVLLVDACKNTGDQYVYNGTFAAREVADDTQKSGYTTLPAVLVNPTPIYRATAADRAARIAPPIQMVVQEAGAIHSVALAVEVVS
jgi:hypothetical protein